MTPSTSLGSERCKKGQSDDFTHQSIPINFELYLSSQRLLEFKTSHYYLIFYLNGSTTIQVPAPGSGVPGAPADWDPPEGLEQHSPVLFLDLNADDFSTG